VVAFRVALSLVVVRLLAPPAFAQFSTEDVNGLIQDNDLPGTFKVDKGTYTALESAGTLSIIVWRTGTSLAGNVSVAYTTIDGTVVRTGGAAGGVLVDLTLVSGTATVSGSGTLSFGAGNTSATFTPASGSVTFGPNDTRKTFTISALTDAAHPRRPAGAGGRIEECTVRR